MLAGKARLLILLLLLCTVLCTTMIFAQDRQQINGYMIPSKAYVGDHTSLILFLPGFTGRENTEVIPEPDPSSPDIDIHRVTLERRPGGSSLTIEFSAYTPGILELPPVTIAGEIFSGLKVEISSILDSDESGMVLSAPALPLAVPGTSLLVYGTISSILLLLLLTSWVLLWGRGRMKNWLTFWKRRRLLVTMWAIERRLHRALLKGTDRREILDVLSTEFRSFLSWFTGVNCRSMTAAEIGSLTLPEEWTAVPAHSKTKIEIPEKSRFLGGFFGRCDNIRFSGGNIDSDEVFALLDDVKRFLTEITV